MASIIRNDVQTLTTPEAQRDERALAHAAVVPMWMDREEVCRYLGVSLRSLRRLVKRGDVERRFVGRFARYRPNQPRGAIRRLIGPRAHPEAPARQTLALAAPDEDEIELLDPPSHQVNTDLQELADAARFALSQRDRAFKERDEALEQKTRAARAQQAALTRIEALVEERDRALEANRALLDEHHKVAQERDDAADRAEARRGQRDDAIKKLARAMAQRDKSLAQLDKSIDQRDKVLAQLDRVILQRDTTLSKLDKAIEERALAIGHYEYARQLLMDWSAWRDSAQALLDESEARAERARELADEALIVPWWNFKRRKQIRAALAVL